MKETLEFVTYERKNTNSMKWDSIGEKYGREDLLPLWIADMDIKAPHVVQEVLHDAAEHGIYGYYRIPDSYYNAFIDWEKRRHGYTVKQEEIRFMSGVVAGLFWCVNVFTKQGDSCMALTPSYGPFLNSVLLNNRKLVCCELIENNGTYSVNFEDFEEKILSQDVKMFMLCSPHNPSGRVWTGEELEQMIAICKKHDVLIISDEIHQDIVTGDKKHLPAMLVEPDYKKLIILTAASKTFNLAGFQNSFAIIRDKELRDLFDHFQKTHCVYKGNRLGYDVVEAAYRNGEGWLEEVLTLLRNNYRLLKEMFNKHAPLAVVSPLEGTYLAWVDLGAYKRPEEMTAFIEKACGLALELSYEFYPKDSEKCDSHVRFNLATSPDLLQKALDIICTRLKGEQPVG